MKISLVGYMGSGKSTLAQLISKKLNLQFIDLDMQIQEFAQASINDIFTYKGEIYFRKTEHQVLNEILQNQDNFVLSTGGGTPCYFDNMQLLNAHTKSIYLHLSPNNLAQRLASQKQKRPLIAHIPDEDLVEFVAKHLFERNNYYQLADMTINANQKTKDEVLRDILDKINPPCSRNE